MATEKATRAQLGNPDEIRAVATDHVNFVRLNDDVLKKMADSMKDIGNVTQNALQSTELERNMTIGQAIRMYRKSVFFSFVLSLSLVMEGYDTSLLGGFFGYPAFQKKFGQGPLADGTYQLSASWQSGLQNGVQVGEILGLWAAGIIAERFGYKKTMLGALVMMIGVIFLMFFAQNIAMLMVGEILCGLPWGAFQTLTTTYAADISPPVLRPYLTAFNNMCVSNTPLCLSGRPCEKTFGVPLADQSTSG